MGAFCPFTSKYKTKCLIDNNLIIENHSRRSAKYLRINDQRYVPILYQKNQ